MEWGFKQEANKENFRDLTSATQNCTLFWNSIGMGNIGMSKD